MLKGNNQNQEELDRVGTLILKAAVADDREIEGAAASPFLFARVRAGINSGPSREESRGWLSLILVARKAVPVMAVIAVLAAVLTILSMQFGTVARSSQSDDESLFGGPDGGVEQTVLATRNGLSRDDVLNIVVDRNYEVNAK